MRRFIGHAKFRGNRSLRARTILGILHQLPDQRFAIFSHALDQRIRKEARRLAQREGNFHSAAGRHLAPQAGVFFGGESRVEVLAVGRDHRSSCGDGAEPALSSRRARPGGAKPRHHTPYASIKNCPPRMICWPSTQMSKFRPTTSMWVDEYHSAPVCAPYGLPNAMWTPGYFSSCRISPITSFNSMFVPMANSPTRLLFSSVWV